ncbi:DUF748 domain-containing protein [Comamonas sp. GB3 AK4-5]|uniref:DUF748 domain-containing protein n=1 Tax=Comamonas sp. GB3 AK4-5 TaxID=3231487 RepID=UPI00351DC297
MQVQIWRSAKLWRSLGWVFAAVLGLWMLAWLSFPWAARQLIEKHGSQALGRQLSVGKVEFSPWSMELTLRDVALAGADGQSEPQVSIARIYIDAELSSLLRWGPVADAIQVDSPHIRLAQVAPGKLDIQDILDKFQTDKPEESSSELPRFALYNIEISDGRLAFNDEVAGAQHALKDLELKLPFVSSLPSKRQVHVAPELSFDLNGSRFASEAQSTPFAQDRKTSATLTVKDLDLKPYLPYWPASLPLKLQDAVLQAKVDVAFEQQTDAVVRLSGHVRAEAAKLQDLAGQDWLQWEALDIDLADVQPLTGQVLLGRVSLQKPSLALRLDAKGQLLQFPQQSKPQAQNTLAAEASVQAKAEAGTAVPAATPTPWKIEVAHWEVQQGHISWSDATVRPAAELAVRDLNLSGSHVTWPMQGDSQFQGRLALAGYEGASHARLSGHGTLERGQLGLELDGVPFEVGRAYVSQFLQPVLRAQADGVAGLAWNRGHVFAVVPQLAVRNLNLGEDKAPLAAWKRLAVENARIDMTQRTVQTELLQLNAPQVKLSRNEKGQWMYESWLRKAPVQQVAVVPKTQATAAAAGPAWSVQAQHTRIRDGVVLLEDGQAVRPVRMGLSGLNLDVQGLDSRMGKQPIVVKLQTRVQPVNARGLLRAGKNDGQLGFDGRLHLAPHLSAEGQLKAQRLPLHLFESYLDGVVNMRLRSAYAGFDGLVRYADQGKGPRVQVQGQAGLQDVYVQTMHRTGTAEKTTMEAGEDLLRWKQLQLTGLAVDLQPGKPLSVQVQKTALRSFFARVVVQPNGRLNLQDLAGAPEAVAAADAAPNAEAKPSESKTVSAPAAPESVAPDPMAPRIVVGPVELLDGTVKFSDFFIQPNYTADLTQLAGSLSAFSSVAPAAGQPPEMADLVLQGMAQSTASLDISGKLNPLVKPLALDITGKVRDLELPPLTPYAVKYAGHGIERGKLSVDVHYQVKPDGMLTANNNLVLHQLTFGDAVQGAPASLPVKLAVALLADRNGVIDIDLPISGSLNDPQFRLGPVIFKVIGNLILKAVTAPFSLLAGVFGGDEKGGGDVSFPAGVATLDTAAKAQLEKIAKSLKDKPALKLTVAGSASTKLDAQGWQAARLEAQIAQRGKNEDDDTELTDKERESRLKSIYRKASIDKPRNVVGLSKSLPPEDMRKLLVEQLPLPSTAMQELAVARAMAVRSYLAAQGIDMARLFLGNSKADGKDAEAKAQLSLAVQ